MNRRLFAIAGLAALAACANAPRGAPGPAGAGFELLEPLGAARADATGVTIRVRSRGCTARSDIAFYIERSGPVPTLAFGRRRVDACIGPAEAIDLTFSWAELGLKPGEPVFVVNPLASGVGQAP